MATDPARCPQALLAGGWVGVNGDGRGTVLYHRWHGTPRIYRSRSEPAWLQLRADELKRWPSDVDCWAIFDNTASSAALPDALELRAMLD